MFGNLIIPQMSERLIFSSLKYLQLIIPPILATFSAVCDNKEMEGLVPHMAYLTHSAQPDSFTVKSKYFLIYARFFSSCQFRYVIIGWQYSAAIVVENLSLSSYFSLPLSL